MRKYVPKNLNLVFLFFFLLAGSRETHAITVRWDGGGGTNNWSEAANWTNNVKPKEGDDVIFDNTSSKNCTINETPPSLGSFTIMNGYTGVVDFGAEKLTIDGNFTANGSGANSGVTAGTSQVVITADGATINSSATLANVAIDTDNSSDVVSLSNDLTISSALNISQGIFVINSGITATATGMATNIGANGTLAGEGSIESNVEGAGTIAPGNGTAGDAGTLTITGTLTPTGILDIDVNAADGSVIDQISVSSTVNLSGATLHLIFNAFDMSSHSYSIITGTGAMGSTGPMANQITDADWDGSPTYANGTITATILPIDLFYFRAALQKDEVVLQWGVASELDNDYMAIERSFDAEDFEEIGRIKGRGTSREATEYELIDKNPRPGVNYYRLRQVDFDGTTTLYDVVSVIVEADAALQVRVYPNPTADFLQLRWPGPVEKETLLRVLDLDGRQVQTYTLPVGTLTYEFALKNLAPATYLLQWERQGRVETARFVKQ